MGRTHNYGNSIFELHRSILIESLLFLRSGLHFKETNRNFSSGCIRTEKPIDLAVYLLKNDPEWTREKLMETIENGSSKVIQLQSPIAVHLEYWTAWVDETDGLNFRSDIYDRDGPLDRALEERFPGA